MKVRTTLFFVGLAMITALSVGVVVGLDGESPEANAAMQNQIHLKCGLAKSDNVDPIRPEANHSHHIFGNPALQDDSTAESLLAQQQTTCSESFVKGDYWTMATRLGVLEIKPFKAAIYYHAAHPDRVGDIKNGLMLLATRDNGQVKFVCGNDESTAQDTPHYGCTNKTFKIVYNFPECWDERSLRPESLVDRAGARCPVGFTEIVSVREAYHYRNPNPGRPLPEPLTVSVGQDQWDSWENVHADAFEANVQPAFDDAIQKCIREGQALDICDPNR
jgi:Domain of unknown function (DUF1996)